MTFRNRFYNMSKWFPGDLKRFFTIWDKTDDFFGSRSVREVDHRWARMMTKLKKWLDEDSVVIDENKYDNYGIQFAEPYLFPIREAFGENREGLLEVARDYNGNWEITQMYE